MFGGSVILLLITGYLLIMNIAGFASMGIDKWKAKHRQWRIPEATLFALAIFGGSLGSVIGMYLLKRFKCFSYIGVSAAGGVLHNMAQIVTAVIMLQTKEIVGYLPFLMVGGLTAGVIIGILCKMTYPVVHKSYYLLK